MMKHNVPCLAQEVDSKVAINWCIRWIVRLSKQHKHEPNKHLLIDRKSTRTSISETFLIQKECTAVDPWLSTDRRERSIYLMNWSSSIGIDVEKTATIVPVWFACHDGHKANYKLGRGMKEEPSFFFSFTFPLFWKFPPKINLASSLSYLAACRGIRLLIHNSEALHRNSFFINSHSAVELDLSL